ncbi:Na+/H+ antiporter [Glycomyces algeriensis]|uniref:Na(+)/H(+) exchanger n=1 Tax=Glycomyces algeriensis TaxID=256037 RepID=A0A9W6GBU7_9ACTN|nr:Na+/H+ antiporter [Glycomyces algeriensis]MDA1365617.1 Na+/H+ antiporter [Glycomyces algeriensis]MDR7351305.1 CPA1 family monovalent cation:H+ antiporter [Glycomyces algeriensis]GLI44020.1 putative Na(+)/H(+) exchanger [Glycomyces algeriensis]
MFGLEFVVVLGITVVACGAASGRLRVAAPVLLLAAGLLLGFVPVLREVELPSEVMLLLFLPPLLYWESLTTSLRQIRRDFRSVMLNSTVLVVATAGAVAVTAHWLGMPWGPAWVLGAAVAPTDATAVAALAKSLPRRTMTMLRAESLINDGTALVVYGIAVAVTVGELNLSFAAVSGRFLLSYLGGAAAGALVAWLGVLVRRRIDDPVLGNVAALVIPFTAYLLAEFMEASGVLAVVVCGLIMSQVSIRRSSPTARIQGAAFWTIATFVLNSALFVLVGIQAQDAVRSLDAGELAVSLWRALVVTGVVVAARFAFFFTMPYLIRLLDRRPEQRARRVGARPRVLSSLCGFRGAVSIAAALGVPLLLDSGEPFPVRDQIVFTTAVVVVLTVVVQGLMLPGVLRWARLPADADVEAERRLALVTTTEAALGVLDATAERLGTDPDVADRMRRDYEQHLEVLLAEQSEADEEHPARRYDRHDTELRLELLAVKRTAVVRLRDEQRIDDNVLRYMQGRIDIEEIRLTGRDDMPE